MKKNITVEILDSLGVKVCDLYDSGCLFPGQITDIKLQYDKKELTVLSFRLPTKISDEETGEIKDNPRWKYIKNEYRVRYTDNGEEEIFTIKNPEETNTGIKITEIVNCLHLAEQLKTRNIATSREAVIGNAEMHLDKILEGTGWKSGKVDKFYEETLYEKYFDVTDTVISAPDDASFGAYAEIRGATGDSLWDATAGWLDADIKVTSIGKNICDGMIEKGGIDEGTGLPDYSTSTTRYRSINYLYVKPFIGKALTISGVNVGGVIWHLYDEKKNRIAVFQDGMTLPLGAESRCAYVKYQILANAAGTASFVTPPVNVQIEVGTSATTFNDYSVPYSVQFSLGKYDTIERNRIIRKTVYDNINHTISEADTGTIENIAVYSIKMYDGGWIYAENNGPGAIDTLFAYTVTAETGGALREKYRSAEKKSGTSCYEEIMALEDLIGGRAVFHGSTKTVDFVRVVGKDTKFAFKPRYNTKSIKRTRSSNEFITRLYVVNQETESGYIGIEDVNPLGTNFIMNFDHFDIDDVKKNAINEYQNTMIEIKPRSKAATDSYIANSTQTNSMVGQTPMGFANIGSINGTEVRLGSGEIYSYLNKDRPSQGDIAYIRNAEGQWLRFNVEDYYNGSKMIILDKAPENGSIIWWMSNIPAGTVGAQIIALNTQYERLDNYKAQLEILENNSEPTDDEIDKIGDLRENIETINSKITELSNGTANIQGLNENFARLVVQVEKFNNALKEIERIADEKVNALDALDRALGEIIYEGVFPQGNYASGQELALYEDALNYLNEHCHPQVEYAVTAIDRTVYGDAYYLETLKFGDIVYVDDMQMGMSNVPAEITSYTDEPLKLSSNAFKLGNFDQNPIEMFDQIVSASKSISESKYKYDKLASMISADGTIAKNVMQKSLEEFELSNKNDIEQLIRSYFTTEVFNNAGINWSRITLLSDEIMLKARSSVQGDINKINEALIKIDPDQIIASVREEVNNDIDSLKSRLEEAELKIEPDKIVATVRESNNYKNDLSTATDDAIGWVTDQKYSTITQTADAIDLAVGKLNLGGINLLRDSAKGAGNADYPTVIYHLGDTIQNEETVTFTIWNSSLGSGKTRWVLYDGSGIYGLCTLESRGNGMYSATFKYNSSGNTGSVALYPFDGSVTGVVSTVGKAKLERGNKSTAWTPSPLDPATEVIAGSSVYINEGSVRITTPEFLVNTNGASFNIPGAEDEAQVVTIDSGGLQANKFKSPEAAPAFAGGYFDSLAAAADRINGCQLTGDVVVRCQENEPFAIFRGVSGPGKVMIAPGNLLGQVSDNRFSPWGTASLIWQDANMIKLRSGGNAWESMGMDVGSVGAMGLRGRRLVFSCNAGVEFVGETAPTYMVVEIRTDSTWLSVISRPSGYAPTDLVNMTATFTVPEDLGYSERLIISFYLSGAQASQEGAAVVYTHIQLRADTGEAISPSDNGVRKSLARIQIDNCQAQFALHRMTLMGLRAYYSNVAASMCSFVPTDGDDAGSSGFRMWGGSGAMDNCTSAGTLSVAAEAIGGGMMHVSGTRPAGAYKGSVNLDASTGEDNSDSIPEPPTTETYPVEASGTYGEKVGWISDNAMRQGYTAANGKMRGAVWFSGSIASGVQKILLRLRRVEGYGKAGDVSVRIYGTTAGVKSGDPAASGKLSSGYVSGKMAPGETRTFDVTPICYPVNYTGYVVMVEDDAVMSGKTYSANYARFTGIGGGEDTRPALTVLR